MKSFLRKKREKKRNEISCNEIKAASSNLHLKKKTNEARATYFIRSGKSTQILSNQFIVVDLNPKHSKPKYYHSQIAQPIHISPRNLFTNIIQTIEHNT